ncbi:MAG: SDR family NAD(P)-dependent oxidoreductase [Hyphomonadaceae bacterium JAD_PAG50586_4]|nr:MAG: SDR family NAD(P)-dependent oxidoreductase [Hyphomonadaceae bacterium JAD_PAG50586_4]
MAIRFDERVVIVTGAGNGLGRSHALQFAERGAKVVVNDFGGARDGTGGSSEPAEKVMAEIKAAGGDAIAHGADVTNTMQVQDMIEKAISKWGRIDVLVNNAGILQDASFAKTTPESFRRVVDVHLMGSAYCSLAVWPHMRTAGYGRIVMTASTSGVYGNFGQASYAAGKTAMLGLMNVLHIEGGKNNIRVNTIIPGAATRLTEGLIPPQHPGVDDAVGSVSCGSLPGERRCAVAGYSRCGIGRIRPHLRLGERRHLPAAGTAELR